MPRLSALQRVLVLIAMAVLTLLAQHGLPRAGMLALFGVAVVPACAAGAVLARYLPAEADVPALLRLLLWFSLPPSMGSWLLVEFAALWHLGTPAWYVLVALLMFASWTLPLLAGTLAALRARMAPADRAALLSHWHSVIGWLALMLAASQLPSDLWHSIGLPPALPAWLWLLLRQLRHPSASHPAPKP